MKIGGPPTNNVTELGSRTGATATEKGREGQSTSSAERVALSGKARWLAELKTAIGDPLEVDQERVAGLRQAIADGSFDPSPREIAQSLLQELPGLGRR